MRYAIFSDIHGNWQAWNAVLADMYDSNVDVPVCLGDIVGYGPCPQKVLDGIREVTSNFVMGNHDAAASGVLDPSMFNDTARAVIEWTRDKLNEDALEFLKDMALVIEDGELLFVHAEIEEPGRFLYIDSEEEAQDNFQYSTQRITFVGHTHDPAIFAENEDKSVTRLDDVDCVLNTDQRYIINVGSVGEPRNPEDIRARYVIFDTETNEISFRRIQFDIEGYRMDLISSGLSIKPYFLTVVDSYLEAVEMAKAADGQMMRDMKTPVHAPTQLSQRKRRIVSNNPSRPPLTRKPLPVIKKSPLPAIFISVFLLVTAAAAGWYFWWLPKQEEAGEIAITHDDPPADGMVGMIEQELNGGVTPNDPGAAAPSDITPPKFVEGATINHWNFDRADGEIGEETLFVNRAPSTKSEPLFENRPKDGMHNHASATGGIWEEPSRSEQYSIRADRSWTFEGWFQLKEITGLKAQKVIAGNRGHTGAGWRFEAREHDGQILNFSYWPDGIQKTANYFNVPAKDYFDGNPHHFAVVWDRNFVAGEIGQIRIYIDGKIQSGRVNGKDDKNTLEIALDKVRDSKESDFFAIGGVRNETKPLQFTGILDELRITAGVKKPAQFLLADKEGNLPKPKPPINMAKAATPTAAPAEKPAAPVVKINTLSSLEDGLIYYAPLDEPSGARVLEDLSTNGRHAEKFQAEIGKPGQIGKAAHFLNGGFNTRNIPMSGINKITFSFWIKLDKEQVLEEKAAEVINIPGFYRVDFDITPQGNASLFPTGKIQSPVFATGNAKIDQNWHHVIVSNDGHRTFTHIDGKEMNNIFDFPLKKNFPQKGLIGIGRTHGNPDGANGTVGRPRFHLDEIAIWRRNLTAAERLHLLKMGRNNVSLLEKTKPVTYWKFDGNIEGEVNLESVGELPKFSGGIEIAPSNIPLTLAENPSGLRITNLKTPVENAADFAVLKDRGFTYEGWFIFNPDSKSPRSAATLGSNTESQDNETGWKLGAIPTRHKQGNLIFLLKKDPNNLQIAQATEQEIFDRKPHHIAAVWKPVNVKTKEGKLSLFIDGKLVAEKLVAEADVPEGQPNPFEIGGTLQDIFVDEVRFSPTALNPANFLIGFVPEDEPEVQKKK